MGDQSQDRIIGLSRRRPASYYLVALGENLHSETCRGTKLRGDEIRPTAKVFDVVLSGDRGAVSVRDIGDDEQD